MISTAPFPGLTPVVFLREEGGINLFLGSFQVERQVWKVSRLRKTLIHTRGGIPLPPIPGSVCISMHLF